MVAKIGVGTAEKSSGEVQGIGGGRLFGEPRRTTPEDGGFAAGGEEAGDRAGSGRLSGPGKESPFGPFAHCEIQRFPTRTLFSLVFLTFSRWITAS